MLDPRHRPGHARSRHPAVGFRPGGRFGWMVNHAAKMNAPSAACWRNAARNPAQVPVRSMPPVLPVLRGI